MIAIFLTKEEAQKFADKCHEYLSANCPNYNASCWQIPNANKDGSKFFVEIPQEFEKDYYPVKEKIAVFTDAEIKKASELKPKPDPDWTNVAPIIKP